MHHIQYFSGLSWKLSTVAIVLGKSILLTCFYRDTSCTDTEIKSWWVNTPRSSLCVNGECWKSNKYKMATNLIEMSFNLEIFGVNNMDIEQSYTCTCGMFKRKQNIKLPGKDSYV